MKIKQNVPATKGMVFAGCSFTWGQGLYYYSDLPTIKEPLPNHYDPALLTDSHVEYMKSVRFPRLVAEHFDSFELCQPFNGGSSYSIHDWWQRCFMAKDDANKHKHANHPTPIPTYSYSEISHVFYQFTQYHRAHSPFKITHQMTHHDAWQHPEFNNWLKSSGMTLQEYEDMGKRKEIQGVKDFLKPFMENNIKVYVLCWPSDIVDYILKDDMLSSCLIKLEYKNKTYNCIEHMTEDHDSNYNLINPELIIYRDLETFDVPPQDHHPSKTCHKVIADSIIKHLEKQQ